MVSLILLPTAALAGDVAIHIGAGACEKSEPEWQGTSNGVKYKLAPGPDMLTWAQGFMSGLNDQQPLAKRRNLAAISPNDQTQRLRAYCAAHPDAKLFEAAEVLYLQFPLLDNDPLGIR
jgi:hypothetical protein